MKALVLPILVPLGTAAILMLAPKRPLLQRWIALAGSVVLLGCAVALFRRVEAEGIQALQMGGWPAPFGITLVADLLAAMLVVAVGLVGVAVTSAAFAGVDPRREAFGYHPLIQIMLMGVAGAFLTGDLFNLYVSFEVMLVASFVLMAMHRTSAQVEAAFKYVTINLIASSIFLTALGLLYGAAGTLNMADLATVWPAMRTPGIDIVLAVLFLIAFGIKAGLFPLFFWLPASYHTPPAAIGAAFAGLLTKVGVYALMRVFTLLLQGAPPALFSLLLGMSAATMVIGLVAAMNERDFRRVLSFNLVGHIGYTTAGLSLLTPAALAGAIFYLLHHIVVITNLFLVSGVLLRLRRTTDMAALGGLYRHQPVFAVLAMVPLFSLAGVPPLSGFLGKLAILEGTFEAEAYWVGGLVLVVGLLTLLSMARVWAEAFWRPSAGAHDMAAPGRPLLLTISILSLVTLGMTIGAEPLFELAARGAHQLLQRDDYIRAVLGGTP
ncbi:MAG TPA: proton-conducting transporter membrane subunit [Vicinamibacterales bacterium]|nr:proton-conducting transporter membrane subunit [Vicinamibacterales bacterium]